jgi:AbrB family looped-hinge helix DNA binding protein
VSQATLSSKFQISIPKPIRDELGLKAGQRFLFVIKGNLIQLVPARGLKEMSGVLKGADTSNIRDRHDRF